MSKILSSKDIIDKNVKNLIEKCQNLTKSGLRPKLEVILVGSNSASELYIKNKRRMCELVGAQFNLTKLKENVSQEDFLYAINKMNNDSSITGCFVQLPIPKHLSHINVTQLINPQKDVDGFHSENIIKLYNNNPSLISCTPKGIVNLLKNYKIEVEGKNVVIIGRGFIVGKPLALLLQNLNATVTICHSKTKDIKSYTRNCDIIICAIGKANFIDKSFLGKNQILIDVGINKTKDGKFCGDINFNDVKDHVQAVTPVPGGVGPMTVYSLIENLIEATDNILQKR
ncbi:MAG: bifunctional 5,10-methylenetetrahydrofolate dehydrogenase/5,10-methenyltetrahydrofolate cyclohydrolase [Bacteriovoracaceae bacterium]|nr:bifunctional 5,10-methylenetetrahydrofolate dehydrogenase/5,10-methenyltetrahydrofolate cyclohydrolase [Bacteriovoracaceae bacterium]